MAMQVAGRFKSLDGKKYQFVENGEGRCIGCVFKDGSVRGCPEIGSICTKMKGIWIEQPPKLQIIADDVVKVFGGKIESISIGGKDA